MKVSVLAKVLHRLEFAFRGYLRSNANHIDKCLLDYAQIRQLLYLVSRECLDANLGAASLMGHKAKILKSLYTSVPAKLVSYRLELITESRWITYISVRVCLDQQ